ncbi:MAG: hypothetical protein PWP47_879 [Synergistaceae bacterium]|jgi:hypothetical protein|nr:hypothetical protein [Synergistaceae bacterium]
MEFSRGRGYCLNYIMTIPVEMMVFGGIFGHSSRIKGWKDWTSSGEMQ